LIAQRIEVLSTKPWQDAVQGMAALGGDVSHWQAQSMSLVQQEAWPAVAPKFHQMLESAQVQLQLVWEAFGAALNLTQAASTDPEAPLPAVPVWAEQNPSPAPRQRADQNPACGQRCGPRQQPQGSGRAHPPSLAGPSADFGHGA
jgi:hypothetical protein